MTAAASSDILALTESVNGYLAQHVPLDLARRRQRGDAGFGYDRGRWSDQARLGWTGIALPEALGGAGLGLAATARLLEVCGKYLSPDPYLSTVALATPLVRVGALAGNRAAEALGAAIAEGSAVVAVAVPSSTDLLRDFAPTTVGSANNLSMRHGPIAVADLPGADFVLVPVTAAHGIVWQSIPAVELVIERAVTLADGRRLAWVNVDEARADPDAVITAAQTFEDALLPVLREGAVLVASWQLGIARRAFELTIEYLKVRRQFGAIIGTYQALQHRAARLHCELEVATSALEDAALAIDDGRPAGALLASAVKLRVGELANRVTAEGIQLHGGIGMTDEADIGLFYKAARSADLTAGSHLFHAQRATALLKRAANMKESS
ncbi:acyl-CoA dehydrogenase family protein [Mycobacteroides abscessus]|uniref:acyl-CoA dehydrogenase family protein n=1 Tax=Mycobacteroides abscessus TaxID=36809 RepID=UPI0009A8DFCE|nr:acyl-CoA dehydrogenase family protein [Mycobacteroides abscessus]SLG56714.1 acyl-CoA dehydrogenase [Mycobacteroides abscessus subsp. abscessus]